MKSIFGGAVVIADIIAGYATPHILAALHKPHPHLTGPVVLYAVLGLATLWVIMQVAGTMRGGGQQAPQRPSYFGSQGRRG